MWGFDDAGKVNTFFVQRGFEVFSIAVLPDDAGSGDLSAEYAQVVSDVGGTSGAMGFGFDIDDGHGCFGRDASGYAPQVVVEHEVADNCDAAIGK